MEIQYSVQYMCDTGVVEGACSRMFRGFEVPYRRSPEGSWPHPVAIGRAYSSPSRVLVNHPAIIINNLLRESLSSRQTTASSRARTACRLRFSASARLAEAAFLIAFLATDAHSPAVTCLKHCDLPPAVSLDLIHPRPVSPT